MSRAEKLLEYRRLLEQKGTWEAPSLTLLFSRAENLGWRSHLAPPTKQGFSSGAGRRAGFPEPRGRDGRWESHRLRGPAIWQGASSRVAAAGLAPTADMSVFAVPATSIPWNPASARGSAYPWRPLGKLEQVARQQACRPPAQGHPGALALVLRLEDVVSTGPYCGRVEVLFTAPWFPG